MTDHKTNTGAEERVPLETLVRQGVSKMIDERNVYYDSLNDRRSGGWRNIGPDEIWQAAWEAAKEHYMEHYADLCIQWACICESGRRHGCAVGARECAALITNPENDA